MKTRTGLQIEAILKNNGHSHWLKTSIRSLLKRDIVDALNGLEYLESLFHGRWQEIREAEEKHLR